MLNDSITAQGATISWKIPFNHDSVVVNFYQVVISEEQFGTPQLTFNVTNVTSYMFEALQEYCTYHCMVAAGNAAYGIGPGSSVSFTTLEAGKVACKNI